MSQGDRPAAGIQAMIAATFFYTLCDAIGKWVLADNNVAMLLFVRSIAAGAIFIVLMKPQDWPQFWRPSQPRLAFLRIITATAETTLFFVAVQYLPLAATISIYLAAPLLVAVLAPWLLQERLTFARIMACLMGFLGVLLLLRPGVSGFEPAALIAILGMIALALTLMTARSLKNIPPMVLVGHQIIGTAIAGGAGLLWFGTATLPSTLNLGLMAAVGISAMIAQYFVAMSMRLAPASVVSPFFYSALIWALLADLAVWHIWPSLASLGAALLIIAAGLWLGRQSS